MKRGKSKKADNKNQDNLFDDKILLTAGVVVFVVLFIALAFVNVPQNSTVTGKAIGDLTDADFIKNMFSNFPDMLDESIAKYVLWFTIMVFLMGILWAFEFPSSKFLRFLLSLGASFLMIAYITPGEVFTLLTTYSAAGLALGVMVPFLAINLASAMLLTHRKMNVGKVIAALSIWVFWVAFLLYRTIKIWVLEPENFLKEGRIILFIVLGVSIVMIIFNRAYRKFLYKIDNEVIRAKAEKQRRQMEEGARTLQNIGGGEEADFGKD